MRKAAEAFAILAKPFDFEELEIKCQSFSERTTKALAVPYIDARCAGSRLDEAFGPENWRDELRHIVGAKGEGMICRLTVRVLDDKGNPVEVWREDAAPLSDIEAIKGGASDAFKRAFAKLGNRSLYDCELGWQPCKVYEGTKGKKFDGFTDEAIAAMRQRYDRQMKSKRTAPTVPTDSSHDEPVEAPKPEQKADPKAAADELKAKVTSVHLNKAQADDLKARLGGLGQTEFNCWVASQHDQGARTYDDLAQNLPAS